METLKDGAMTSKSKRKIIINVGGTVFQCYPNTLKTFENSLLAKLDERCENFDEKCGEFFFDRSPRMFEFILDAHRTGILHLPKDVCGGRFKSEMEFWGISSQCLSPCCWGALYKSETDVQTIQTLRNCNGDQNQEFKDRTLRHKIWRFLHEPRSSKYALCWSVFIGVVVVGSLLLSAIETVHSARNVTGKAREREDIRRVAELLGWSKNSSYLDTLYAQPIPVISVLNALCFVILTSELTLTILSNAKLSNVLKSWLNVAEVFSCIAFWITFALEQNGMWKNSTAFLYIYIVCKYVLILRLARLFRAGKHISAFRVLGLTFKSSKEEMHVLALMLFILTTLFGTSLYLVEAVFSDKLESIFDAMYWSLITLTTVGYGDYVPTTPIGRIITCACAVCGILMLVIPVGIITTSFHYLYEQHKYVSCHIKENKVSGKRNHGKHSGV